MKPLLKLTSALALVATPQYAFATDTQPPQKANMTEPKSTAPISSTIPMAEKRPHNFTVHGVTISDDYHWLKDQSYPTIDDKDILTHLNAENAHYEAEMKPQAALTEMLFQEMKGRIKEDDSTVPQKDGKYIYWSKFEEGAQYRKHYRKKAPYPANIKGDPGLNGWLEAGPDQLILDENILAKGKEYFKLAEAEISPDGKLLAYAYDDDGSERFELHIRDLATGKDLKTSFPARFPALFGPKIARGWFTASPMKIGAQIMPITTGWAMIRKRRNCCIKKPTSALAWALALPRRKIGSSFPPAIM